MRAWKAFLCHRLIVVSFIPDRRIFVLLCLFILDNMTAIIEKTNTFIRHFILCAAEKALWIVFIYCHIALHLICWGFLFVMVVVSCCLSLMPLKKAYERIWNANVYIYSSINAFLLYLFLSVLCHSPFLVWENANHTLLPWCTQSFSMAYAFISRLETRFSATFPVYFHHLHNGHAFRNAYGCRSHHTHTHTHTPTDTKGTRLCQSLCHTFCSHCRNQKLMWVELDETENPKNGVQKKKTANGI